MAPFGPFGPVVAVGCSGGPDSLALTWLAAEWAASRGVTVLALICDHGLRAESSREAEGVQAQLAGQGIAARVLRLGLSPGPRLQERARQARRAALLATCQEAGALHLLLGHHAEDQAETRLFRAMRGSGPAGLAGMAPVLPMPEAIVLRPLLAVPKARLAATLDTARLQPVNDPSNADARFARTRLRGIQHGGLGEAGFAQRQARLAHAVAERLGEAARLLPEGCARLDLVRFGKDAIADRALALLVAAVGGGTYPLPAGRLLAEGRGSLGGCVLGADGWLYRDVPGPPLPAVAGTLWDGRFRLGASVAGHVVGALGADAASFRARHRHLPARAMAALPCLRDAGDGMLAAVPHLTYPEGKAAQDLPLTFAPRCGPVTEFSAIG